MEHLSHSSSARNFRREIRDLEKVLSGAEDVEWLKSNHKSISVVEPCVRWLGHNHEASSTFSDNAARHSTSLGATERFRTYGLEWADPLECRNLRDTHKSLAVLDDDEVCLRIASFMQASLFLGLLEGICGTSIPASLFLRDGDAGETFLYTAWLPSVLEWWRRGLSLTATSFSLAEAQRCNLQAATIMMNLLSAVKSSSEPLQVRLYENLLRIEPGLSAIHEFISDFIEHHSDKKIRSFSGSESPNPRGYSERLVSKGWCPFVIATAETNMSPSLLRYLDAAGYSLPDGGHHLCTSDRCRRNQVNLATYTVSHRSPRCRCMSVKPDLGLVCDILEDDYIPLVQFQPDTKTLKVGALDPEYPEADYVVFSHVWADGLGSCTESGLPICQIERLHELAGSALKGEVWFWIDGLCVPKKEPFRHMAIQSMKFTYADAFIAIVLDNGIRRISVTDNLFLVSWSLYASGWMGRLWTYQEGFIPPRVDLELEDGLCQIYEMVQRLYRTYVNKDKGSPVPAILAKDLVAALQKVRPLDRKFRQRERVRQVVDVFNALTRRLTSRPEDQLLVLSLLLDVELDKILAFDGDLRWREFYLALKEIPWTIVFDRRPKLTSLPGFRWAPSTWISSGKDAYLHYDDALATCTGEGLCIKLVALQLEEACQMMEEYLQIQVEDEYFEIKYLSRVTSTSNPPPHCEHEEKAEFNIIFVRYFKNVAPKNMLFEYQSTWLSAGVGLQLDASSSSSSPRPLPPDSNASSQEAAPPLPHPSGLEWYDFSDDWQIRWIDEPDFESDESGLVNGVMKMGQWVEREFLFT